LAWQNKAKPCFFELEDVGGVMAAIHLPFEDFTHAPQALAASARQDDPIALGRLRTTPSSSAVKVHCWA
jgi:hypothetical protein